MAVNKKRMNYARFNLVTLALVVAVARAGSISAGAKEANLAMAAASKRLGDFEAQIGTPIFYRRSNGVELTSSGRAIIADVLSVLDDVERLATNIADYSSGTRGNVRIWANPTTISDTLPDDIGEFAKLYPDVGLEFEERDSSQIVKAVAENRADIGIFSDSPDTRGIETFVFREDELVFVVPAKHALAKKKSVKLEEVLQHPLVGLLAGTPLASMVDYEAAKIGLSPQMRVQVRGVEPMCRMISVDLGIGLLPINAAARYLKSMGLKTLAIDEPWARRRVYIGVRDSQYLPNAARKLLQYLRNSQKSQNPVNSAA